MKNTILLRYVFKQFALIFLATLFVLTAVIMLFDIIELLRIASKKESIAFLDVALLALLKSPQMIHIILPFITLIAGLIFLFKFSRSSELIVMRAVGLSVWNFISPMIIFILFIGVFSVTVFNPFSAMTARRYERLEERLGMTNSTPFSWSEDGFWLRDIRADDSILVIRAARVRQEKKDVLLDNISVFELAPDDTFLRQNEAEVGTLTDGKLILNNAFVIDNHQETSATVPQVELQTELNLDKILEKFDEPQTMSFWRFPRFIRFLKESGFASETHEMYWYELLAFPFTLVAMLMISIVFALPPTSRQGKVFFRIICSILGGFLLYFLTRITNVMGQAHNLPMLLAAFGPAFIVIPICLSALLHLEDG